MAIYFSTRRGTLFRSGLDYLRITARSFANPSIPVQRAEGGEGEGKQQTHALIRQDGPALVKHRQMLANIAMRAGDKFRREGGNKLPGKLQTKHPLRSIGAIVTFVALSAKGGRSVPRKPGRKIEKQHRRAVNRQGRARAPAKRTTTTYRGGGSAGQRGNYHSREQSPARAQQTRREKRRYQVRIFITSRLEYPEYPAPPPPPPRPVIYQLSRVARKKLAPRRLNKAAEWRAGTTMLTETKSRSHPPTLPLSSRLPSQRARLERANQ